MRRDAMLGGMDTYLKYEDGAPVGILRLSGASLDSSEFRQFKVEWCQRLGRESSNFETAKAISAGVS